MLRKMCDKKRKRLKRKFHIRKRIFGTIECPRMTVTRSNKNLYIQVIDDSTGKTLAAISTLNFSSLQANVLGSEQLGEEIGKCLVKKHISTIVFDRNGYLYHGVIKALADGLRKVGIIF